jgi:hypothetical protein
MFTELKRMSKVVKCMAAGYKRGIFKLPEFSETEKVIKLNGKEKNLPSIPRIIWVYWEEDELPELIEGFISKLRRFDEGYVINVLSKNTLHKFLPSFTCHPEVPIANKTDLIRLDLLHKYGGVWLDITILLQENLSWLHHPDLENRYDLIGFYRDVNTVDEKYPVIETWFLASSPGNRFIKNWLDILTPMRELGSKAIFEILKKRDDYKKISRKIEPPDYLLVYLACQIVLQSKNDYSFYLRKAENSAFYLQNYYGWNPNVIAYALTQLDSRKSNFELIKLTAGDRSLLDVLKDFNLIKSWSLIGQLISH